MEFQKERVYSAVNADGLKSGDKVIVADAISTLKRWVESGSNAVTNYLLTVLDEEHPYRFQINDGTIHLLAYLVERKENCTNCGEGRWDAEHKKILCDPVNCGNGNVVFRNHEIEVCEYYKPITKQKVEHNCETCKYVNCGFKDFNTKNDCDRWEPEIKTEKKCEDCTKDEICVEGKNIYKNAPCPYHSVEKHYRPFKDTDELIKVWCEKISQWHDSLEMPYIWVRSRFNKDHKGVLINNYFGEYVELGTVQCFLTRLFNEYTFLDGSVCGVEE